jgi:hypothetical protein
MNGNIGHICCIEYHKVNSATYDLEVVCIYSAALNSRFRKARNEQTDSAFCGLPTGAPEQTDSAFCGLPTGAPHKVTIVQPDHIVQLYDSEV